MTHTLNPPVFCGFESAGGSIEFHPKPGGGTVVTVTVPDEFGPDEIGPGEIGPGEIGPGEIGQR
jgi:hypothetical protein